MTIETKIKLSESDLKGFINLLDSAIREGCASNREHLCWNVILNNHSPLMADIAEALAQHAFDAGRLYERDHRNSK